MLSFLFGGNKDGDANENENENENNGSERMSTDRDSDLDSDVDGEEEQRMEEDESEGEGVKDEGGDGDASDSDDSVSDKPSEMEEEEEDVNDHVDGRSVQNSSTEESSEHVHESENDDQNGREVESSVLHDEHEKESSQHSDEEKEKEEEEDHGLSYKGEYIDLMSYRTLRTHLKELQLSTAGKTHLLRNRLNKAMQPNNNATPMSTVKKMSRTPVTDFVSPMATLTEDSVALGTRSHDMKLRRKSTRNTPKDVSQDDEDTTKSVKDTPQRKRSTRKGSPVRLATAPTPKSISASARKATRTKKDKQKENDTVRENDRESKDRSELVKGILLNKSKIDPVSYSSSHNDEQSHSEMEAYFSEEYEPAASTRSDQITPLPNTVEFNIAAASSDMEKKYSRPSAASSSSSTSLDQLDDDMVSVTATIGSSSSPLHFSHGTQSGSRVSSTSKRLPTLDNVVAPVQVPAPTLDSLVGQRFMNVMNDEGPELTEKEYLFFKSFLEKKKPTQLEEDKANALLDERQKAIDNVLPSTGSENDTTGDVGKHIPKSDSESLKSSVKEVENTENVPPLVENNSATSSSSSPLQDKSDVQYMAAEESFDDKQFPGHQHGQTRHSHSGGRLSEMSGFQPNMYPPYPYPPYPYPQLQYPYHQFPPYQNSPYNYKKRELQELDLDSEQGNYDRNDPAADVDSEIVHENKRRHIDNRRSYGGVGSTMGSGAAPALQIYPSYDTASQNSLGALDQHQSEVSSTRSSWSLQPQPLKRPLEQKFSNGYTPRFQENVGTFSESSRRSSTSSSLSNIQKRRMKRRLMGSNASVSSVTSSPRASLSNTPAPTGAIAKRILDTLGVLTSTLDDQRQMPVPSGDIAGVNRRLRETSHGEVYSSRNVQFSSPAEDDEAGQDEGKSSGKKMPRKVYATTPYRSSAARQGRMSSGERRFVKSNDRNSIAADDAGEDKDNAEDMNSDCRRDSDASTSAQLWSRDQGQSRKSSLSPPFTPAVSSGLRGGKYVEKLDDTIILDNSDEDNEFTFNSPTVCIEGLTEDAVSGVKSRHSISQTRRSSINFAFSPPAKRRPATEVKATKSSSSFSSTATNPISMAKLDEKSPAEKAKTSAPGGNSLWAKALNTVKCEVCLVPNDKGVKQCVACEAPLGGSSASSKDVAPTVNSSKNAEQKTIATPAVSSSSGNSLWAKALSTTKCEVCLVPNEKGAAKCVACEAPLGGGGSSGSSNSNPPAPKTASFGSFGNNVKSSPSTTSTTSTDKKPSFSFGSTSAAPGGTPSSEKKSSFTFGTTPTVPASTSSTETKSDTSVGSSSFATTLPEKKSETADVAAKPKPSFSFGSSSTATVKTPSTTDPVSKTSSATFSFGSSTAKSTDDSKKDKSTLPGATFGASKDSSGTSTEPVKAKSQFGFLSSASKPAENKTTPAALSFAPKPADTTSTAPKATPSFSFGGAKSNDDKKDEPKSAVATTEKPAPSFTGFSSFASTGPQNKEKDESKSESQKAPSAVSTSASGSVSTAPATFGGFGKTQEKSDTSSTSSAPKPAFSFGATSSTASTTSKEPAPFKFGSAAGSTSTPSSAGSTAPSFVFGDNASKSKPSASSFSFGGASKSGSDATVKAPAFSFGKTSTSDKPAPLSIRASSPQGPTTSTSYGADSPGSTMDMGYASGDVSDNSLPPAVGSFGGFGSSSTSSTTFAFGQSGGKDTSSIGKFGSSAPSSTSGGGIFGSSNTSGNASFGGGASKPSSTFSFGGGNSNAGAPTNTPTFGAQSSTSGIFGQSGNVPASAPTFGQSNSFSSTSSFGGAPSSTGLTFGGNAGALSGGGQFGAGISNFGGNAGLPKSSSSASLGGGGGGGGFSIGAADKSTDKSARRKVKAKHPSRK